MITIATFCNSEGWQRADSTTLKHNKCKQWSDRGSYIEHIIAMPIFDKFGAAPIPAACIIGQHKQMTRVSWIIFIVLDCYRNKIIIMCYNILYGKNIQKTFLIWKILDLKNSWSEKFLIWKILNLKITILRTIL